MPELLCNCFAVSQSSFSSLLKTTKTPVDMTHIRELFAELAGNSYSQCGRCYQDPETLTTLARLIGEHHNIT
jgi:hypothetical protein